MSYTVFTQSSQFLKDNVKMIISKVFSKFPRSPCPLADVGSSQCMSYYPHIYLDSRQSAYEINILGSILRRYIWKFSRRITSRNAVDPTQQPVQLVPRAFVVFQQHRYSYDFCT